MKEAIAERTPTTRVAILLPRVLNEIDKMFKTMRRMTHSYIGTKTAVSAYIPAQELETKYFLSRIYRDPDSLLENIRLWVYVHFLRATTYSLYWVK